jgi:hypothetical protein
MTIKTLFDTFFHDKQGKIVIWETPNWTLIGWAFFRVLNAVHFQASLRSGFVFLSAALLFAWSLQEIVHGDSYFRRFLGVAVLLSIVLPKFMK